MYHVPTQFERRCVSYHTVNSARAFCRRLIISRPTGESDVNVQFYFIFGLLIQIGNPLTANMPICQSANQRSRQCAIISQCFLK